MSLNDFDDRGEITDEEARKLWQEAHVLSWLLTRRLGGEVRITEQELQCVPHLPLLISHTDPATGDRVIRDGDAL